MWKTLKKVWKILKSVKNLEKSVKNGFKILQGSFTGPYDGLAKTLALTYDSMKNNHFRAHTCKKKSDCPNDQHFKHLTYDSISRFFKQLKILKLK